MFYKLLRFAEYIFAYLQGKGWGGGTVEKEFRSAISLINADDIKLCIDIGGNKGTYTAEIIKKLPNTKVVVFEPSNFNVDILNEKFRDKANITIEEKGVSNSTGEATLFSNEDGSALASLTKRRLDHFNIDFENTETVETIVFEDYWRDVLKEQHISVCKIDIEGHELDALSGFGDALNHVDVIQFEFGGCNIDTRTYFQDFWYFFQDAGFELYRITPFGAAKIEYYRELDEFFATTNYLAKRIC
jgi:FkbM family methyltransferase